MLRKGWESLAVPGELVKVSCAKSTGNGGRIVIYINSWIEKAVLCRRSWSRVY
jgi:hypothetical protein